MYNAWVFFPIFSISGEKFIIGARICHGTSSLCSRSFTACTPQRNETQVLCLRFCSVIREMKVFWVQIYTGFASSIWAIVWWQLIRHSLRPRCLHAHLRRRQASRNRRDLHGRIRVFHRLCTPKTLSLLKNSEGHIIIRGHMGMTPLQLAPIVILRIMPLPSFTFQIAHLGL
ncbi:hypothetical protein C8R43DRAFT_39257 [Mycena crocata]|nr:hypothetical protein C8R43DRAFT_39257 [Mycena crocata]